MSECENLHMQAAVHAWMVECFGVSVTVDVVERADRFIEEALELAQATGWTADRGHALVDYVFGRPAGQIGQEVGGVMVTLCALCNTHGVDTDTEAWREINRITQPDLVLKIREKQASKPVGSALPGASAPVPSTDGYVAAFYEIAAMLGIGAKTYSPAEAFERDIKPRLANLLAGEMTGAASVGVFRIMVLRQVEPMGQTHRIARKLTRPTDDVQTALQWARRNGYVDPFADHSRWRLTPAGEAFLAKFDGVL